VACGDCEHRPCRCPDINVPDTDLEWLADLADHDFAPLAPVTTDALWAASSGNTLCDLHALLERLAAEHNRDERTTYREEQVA
jgi:hypothetical protein